MHKLFFIILILSVYDMGDHTTQGIVNTFFIQ